MMSLRAMAAVAAALCLTIATPVVAQKKDAHGHGKETHFKVTPPADLKAAWTSIATKLDEADKNIASKNVEPLHEISEYIEAAVHVLQEKSTMVTGEKLKRLESALKQFDKTVDDFHHAAEDKKAAQVSVEIKKIRGLLPLIEAQYPPGILK